MIQIPHTKYSLGIQGVLPSSDVLPERAIQLNQIHSSTVLLNPAPHEDGDGMFFKKGEHLPVLRVADCLPVFAIWQDYIGAAHAGWRGLANGIIENLLTTVNQPLQHLILGPCICRDCYEVGQEVVEALFDKSEIIYPSEKSKYFIDLRKIAFKKVQRIAGNGFNLLNIKDCTFESEGLHSFRQNKTIDRNYIWLAETE